MTGICLGALQPSCSHLAPKEQEGSLLSLALFALKSWQVGGHRTTGRAELRGMQICTRGPQPQPRLGTRDTCPLLPARHPQASTDMEGSSAFRYVSIGTTSPHLPL